ncbi:MAG: ATP-binding protein [Saprospiraceae bacterium]
MDQPLLVVEHSPVGFLLFEKMKSGPVCVWNNPAAARLLALNELTSRPPDAIFNEAAAAELLAGKGNISFFEQKEQRWLLLESREIGKRLIVSLTDMTAQKEAAFSDARLLGLYKTLSSALADNEIILFDQDFNVLFTEGTPRFIRINPETDLVGSKFDTLVSEGQFGFIHNYLKDVFVKDRSDFQQEVEGRFFNISLCRHHRDGETEASYVGILLLKDVTESQRAIREMEAVAKKLDRSNKDLEDFAYTASHDLQAPLRKIQSFGKLLADRYQAQLTGNGQMFLERMIEAARHMERLLGDLLSYSRATRQGSAFEATDLFDTLLQVFRENNVSERARVNVDVPDGFPSIEAIPLQIFQLFQNLVENAIKFTPAERTTELDIRFFIDVSGEFATRSGLPLQTEYVVLRFADNGIGFEQDNAERIFQIFQRLHALSEYSGSGVGLAICKKIVENHNGAIFAEGEEGKGATFTVVLPLNQ